MRKGEGSGRTTDDDVLDRKSGASCGKEETSSRESVLELSMSSLLITVTREELKVGLLEVVPEAAQDSEDCDHAKGDPGGCNCFLMYLIMCR